jgi:hypothetical protein
MSHLPDPHRTPTLDVPAAGALLGVSRGVAFSMANEYLRTDGASGLPVIRCGKRLKVPTAALLRLLQVDTAA